MTLETAYNLISRFFYTYLDDDPIKNNSILNSGSNDLERKLAACYDMRWESESQATKYSVGLNSRRIYTLSFRSYLTWDDVENKLNQIKDSQDPEVREWAQYWQTYIKTIRLFNLYFEKIKKLSKEEPLLPALHDCAETTARRVQQYIREGWNFLNTHNSAKKEIKEGYTFIENNWQLLHAPIHFWKETFLSEKEIVVRLKPQEDMDANANNLNELINKTKKTYETDKSVSAVFFLQEIATVEKDSSSIKKVFVKPQKITLIDYYVKPSTEETATKTNFLTTEELNQYQRSITQILLSKQKK